MKEQGNDVFGSETQNMPRDTSGRGQIKKKRPILIMIIRS